MFPLNLNTVVSFPADPWITPCPTVTTQTPGREVGGAGVGGGGVGCESYINR